MNKLNIRTREGELTYLMSLFAINSANTFRAELRLGKYGPNFNDCAYSNSDHVAWVKLNKTGSISVLVSNK